MKTKILYTSLLFISILLFFSCCTCDDDNCTEQTWYQDLDHDGFGDSNVSLVSCTQPVDYVLVDEDCDDTEEAVNPNGIEVCDGKDNDCSGIIDEGFDQDQDGFTTCQGDCNDADPETNPDAPEICYDGTDNDCDGEVDEDC